MQYRKMSEDELKQYYGRYAHRYSVEMGNGGVAIRDCRSDHKALGRSNLIFHLPMPGVLLDNTGKDYDVVTDLFPWWTMAELIWKGFSKTARVLLGVSVLGDEKKSFKSHFEVTFDSKMAKYIYIRDLTRVPDALLQQAMHYHLGNPEAPAIIDRYNHYVFPLGLSYREQTAPKQNAKDKYIIERVQQNVNVTKSAYRMNLRRQFGELPLVEWKEAVRTRGYTAEHYEDDMTCQCSFVVDVSGRLLIPVCSPDKSCFIGATMVATEDWEKVPEDAVIAVYRSTCFSLPAEYTFDQRPEKFSPEQVDRLMLLAKKMQKQRLEKATEAGMAETLNTSSDEKAWQ